jgi:hypothetical protein
METGNSQFIRWKPEGRGGDLLGVLSLINVTEYDRLKRKSKEKICQIKNNLPDFAVEKSFV